MSELLTIAEVSKRLDIPVATLYRWRVLGYGPRAAKIGRHLRYRADEVDRWVLAQELADAARPR